MRRLLVNIILVFFCLATVASLSAILIAEAESNAGSRLAAAGRFDEARGMLRNAILLNPLDAKYYSELGQVLHLVAVLRKNDPILMQEARICYLRALELCPRSAEYAISLGQTELDIDRRKLADASRDFEIAVSNDPNGFNTLYQTSYALLSVWDDLAAPARRTVLDRLKRCLVMRPNYYPYIYPKLWSKTKDFSYLIYVTPDSIEANERLYEFMKQNELWQFRKSMEAAMEKCLGKARPDIYKDRLREKEERIRRFKDKYSRASTASSVITESGWQGMSSDGKFEFKNGEMYWSGTVNALVDLPKGKTAIAITMRGEPAYGIYPYVIVGLDGETIGETFLDSNGWKEYIFPAQTGGGVKVLSVTYINDISDPKRKLDRNLFVGKAEARQ